MRVFITLTENFARAARKLVHHKRCGPLLKMLDAPDLNNAV